MNKEKFTKILQEYDYSYIQIEVLWETRPDSIKESRLRATAGIVAPVKDKLVQR